MRKIVQSPWAPDPKPQLTLFSPCDQTSVAIATARATFFQDIQLEAYALEQCLTLVLEDLPFLSGR